ncbi:NAD-glutamate dehydrogenase [Jiella sp. MQZ9-1]|uniref:NAD-glutamate dehydrogenase n=1 Tax=Jiella flava TaxID=2816857 RepID=A0A939FV84_9HYPH|nr:NAD-glutamate dehydrogenase [Jiella flava]MBO0662127.1 NAD-glutamate dehydrogenase [Jiella flava]MCD2470544.1 NAD-glutamate dehydrogenase [Jiella flava]
MIEDVNGQKAKVVEAVTAALGECSAGAKLAPLLFARPPGEDLATFETVALAAAARTGAEALATHRRGKALVWIDRPDEFRHRGELQDLVTIVSDDMAFLFGSLTAEIADRANEIHYISHPILDVTRDESGTIVDFSASRPGEETPAGTTRTSLIQFAVDPMTGAEPGSDLSKALETILAQVGHANRDFQAMRERVSQAVDDLDRRGQTLTDDEQKNRVSEAARLLEWLRDDNFIFLGTCEYDYNGESGGEVLQRRQSDALGILSDPDVRILGRPGRPMITTPEIRAFLKAASPLIVTKANARSRVHRRAYMDYIGVKLYDTEGQLTGELRIIGLFTSTAYTRSILTIPYVRLKAQTVIAHSGFHPQSHSGKALLNALESYPRDEVFQIDVERLERYAAIVVELGERPRVRVLPRVDKFDRFASIIVYVPRDRYDSRLRERIGHLLADAYDGHVSAYYPAFPEGLLARVHIIIGRAGDPTPEVDVERLEARIAEMAKNWEDEFIAALGHAGAPAHHQRFASGLPGSYRDSISPAEAVHDVAVVQKLSDDEPLVTDFYRRDGDTDEIVRLKIYHLGKAVALSTRVPILENMGFGVVSERTFRIALPSGESVHLHDMDLVRRRGGAIGLDDGGEALQAAFGAVWHGRIENDGFNALVLEAGLNFRKANVLRAYARYLRQAGLGYSPDYLSDALVRQPAITTALWRLFETSLDPAEGGHATGEAANRESEPENRQAKRAMARGAAAIHDAITTALDAVDSIDDDRILRRFLNVILATLRTNYFAVDGMSADAASEPGKVAPALAFKLDSASVEGLPAPVPYREIFVFDARVEGVHLRFGQVARGGLRWSDRAQDYRTEVLGLVKAQQVKNAVIVPVGAKGGFYPKRLPDAAQRDAWFKAGRAAYVVFVASLLSVTDNIVGEAVLPPDKVRRHDGDDPYFVVAADKGTATFSDTANAIARSEDFWLDDAFASGGSAGYDHKAMGITARGAWEAVKRHFREVEREESGAWDIQSEPFTAVGCGDMSGDVFGNGMLLSQKTRLVAAFDHRDIFIDPDPDAAASFEERKRLFELPRSSWQDYDTAKISHGGGVFSRKEKLIHLSDEAMAAIGYDRNEGTPSEIIAAILKAPVDLLWFGGIGTYVRATSETNVDVGDRANDAVRVTAAEVRAKVIGEGANLGVTQRGRIEFARKGGRINSDAIDNSAGVNTSDVEVNIKIALKAAMSDGRLNRKVRNALLAAMTREVAELVLANNYEQTLAISLEQREGVAALALQSRFMSVLEGAGHLDRSVETLPSDGAIADLRSTGQGLTRPEIGVILAYAKITLFDDLVAGDLPDDPYLEDRLHDYFPMPMRRDFSRDIKGHRLAREIIATVLANEMVNRTGPTFVTTMEESTGASPSAVVQAFVAAKDGFDIRALYERIDALDTTLAGTVQNGLYRELGRFLHRLTLWYVLNESFQSGLTSVVIESRDALGQLGGKLTDLASAAARDDAEQRAADWARQGVPDELAKDIARLPLFALIPDIAAVSRETGQSLEETVAAYFDVTHLFEIGRLEGALFRYDANDYFETLALQRAESQIAKARRQLTAAVLTSGEAVDAWAEARHGTLDRVRNQLVSLAGSGETSVSRLTVAAGLLSDLAGQV